MSAARSKSGSRKVQKMIVKVLGSGSSGNCYLIYDGKHYLLLDAGLSFAKIQERSGFITSKISGALITHEHGDHIKGARDLVKRGIPIYGTHGTFSTVGLSGYWVHKIKPLEQFKIEGYSVIAFAVDHDAVDPVGYFVKSDYTGKSLVYITDTYKVDYVFGGVNTVMIECNYIHDLMMQNEQQDLIKYGYRLIKTHMELDTVLRYLDKLQESSRIEEVYLLHLSDGNSDEKFMKKKVQEVTGARVYVA